MMISKHHIIALPVLLALSFSNSAQQRVCSSSIISGLDNGSNIQHQDFQTIYIPILFHVVYSSSVQNITREQIHSQLSVLNRDFSATNNNYKDVIEAFQPDASSANVQFYLYNDSKLDLTEIGINRIATNHGPFVNGDLQNHELGGASSYLPDEVLNVWVADLGGDVFGYSQSPVSYAVDVSGVVVDYEYLGTTGTVSFPFDGGRTLTHEVGHFFGLSHPWGVEGCADGDGIEDTPEQDGPATKCEQESMDCDHLMMVQNYMNLTPDACMSFFTNGQVSVMRNELSGLLSKMVHESPVLNSSITHDIEIFPVPVSDRFFLHADSQISKLTLREVTGREVDIQIIKGEEYWEIIPNGNSKGCHVLTYNRHGRYYSKKLILIK